jgi:hypothetical protein
MADNRCCMFAYAAMLLGCRVQVWPGATHYPDFLAVNRTWPWWKDQLQRLWDQVDSGSTHKLTTSPTAHARWHALAEHDTPSCLLLDIPTQ